MKLTRAQRDLLVNLNDGWNLLWSYDEQRYEIEKRGARYSVYTSTVNSLRENGLILNFGLTPAGKSALHPPLTGLQKEV